jgi:hypothetical protein
MTYFILNTALMTALCVYLLLSGVPFVHVVALVTFFSWGGVVTFIALRTKTTQRDVNVRYSASVTSVDEGGYDWKLLHVPSGFSYSGHADNAVLALERIEFYMDAHKKGSGQ